MNKSIGEPKEVLNYLGLTKSEAAVYLALLKLGSTTTGPIIKNAKIAQGKVYIVLEKLINKGIITNTIISGTKHFQAKDPKRLLDWFKEKEDELNAKKEQLNSLIPKLEAEHKEAKYLQQVEIYEGFKGLKTLYKSMLDSLKKNDEILLIVSFKTTSKELEDYFLRWHQRRLQKGIKMKILYSISRNYHGKKRETMKNTKVRYLNMPENPGWTIMYKDTVISGQIYDSITLFYIKSKTAFGIQKTYFEEMWKHAKERSKFLKG